MLKAPSFFPVSQNRVMSLQEFSPADQETTYVISILSEYGNPILTVEDIPRGESLGATVLRLTPSDHLDARARISQRARVRIARKIRWYQGL